MTNDELKKYKDQIARLKREFHKDTPENIEQTSGSTNDSSIKLENKEQKVEPKKENPFLKAIKQGDNLKKIDSKLSSVTENFKKTESVEIDQKVKESEKKILLDSKALENDSKIQKETNNIKEIVSKEKNEIKKQNQHTTKESTIKEKPVVIEPPKQANKIDKNNYEDAKSKSSILKYLIPIFLILFIIGGVYYFLNKNNTQQKITEENNRIEKAFNDSLDSYNENQVLINDSKESEENAIEISDTIFNLISTLDPGYYAILGSYSDLKNAKRLKRKQKTKFEAVVFEQNPIRVGLKLNENNVFNDLDEVRVKYPNAWLIFNKN